VHSRRDPMDLDTEILSDVCELDECTNAFFSLQWISRTAREIFHNEATNFVRLLISF